MKERGFSILYSTADSQHRGGGRLLDERGLASGFGGCPGFVANALEDSEERINATKRSEGLPSFQRAEDEQKRSSCPTSKLAAFHRPNLPCTSCKHPSEEPSSVLEDSLPTVQSLAIEFLLVALEAREDVKKLVSFLPFVWGFIGL